MTGVRAFVDAPQVRLGRWPTPVEQFELPGGGDALVKRDDLSGVGRGGAKARKIERLLGFMLERGHDELITIAGNVTNLAFDLLPPLRAAGIRATVLIVDEPCVDRALRERLFGEIVDQVRLLGPSRAAAAAAAVRAHALARSRGRRPLLAFPGAAHPAAVAGNAAGLVELVEQLEADGRPVPGTVFVTAASGTTLAGFLLAEHALRMSGRAPIEIVGVQAYPAPLRVQVRALIRWTERRLRLKSSVPIERMRLVGAAHRGPFGRFDESLVQVCERAGAAAGITLDPIFGARTWAAMERRGACAAAPPLYWHCGYTPEWREIGRALPA